MSINFEKYLDKLIGIYDFSQMYFDENTNLGMKKIYEAIEQLDKINQKEEIYITWNKDYDLYVEPSDWENFINLSVVNKRRASIQKMKLLKKPIRFFYNGNYYDIITIKQFNHLIKSFGKNINLKFYCCNEYELESLKLSEILMHINCNGPIKLLDFNFGKEKDLEKESFDLTFKKTFPRDKIFKTPNEFEKHYSDYFDFSRLYRYNYQFEFFDDFNHNREKFIIDIFQKTLMLNNFYYLYGKKGIGKSISLIKVFKYECNHMSIGTLYINCKTISKAYKNNIEMMKIIIKDEVIYLFQNEYEQYNKCVDIINKYVPSEFSTFWDLIKIIIKFCTNEDKQYFLIFDQYQNELDKGSELFELNNMLKGKRKFSIIACASINDKDVRDYKIINLFEKAKLKNLPDNIEIIEVKLFEWDLVSLDNSGKFDEAFNKIGKTVKKFLKLLQIKRENPTALNKYIDEKKK